MADDSTPIWQPRPDRMESSQIFRFLIDSSRKRKISPTWPSLYKWSIEETEEFWGDLADFCEIIWQKPPTNILSASSMTDSQWFVESRLNFAENLMIPIKNNPREVLISFVDGSSRRSWTGPQLWNDVAKMTHWLRSQGVQAGDRIAGVLTNGPEAIIAMLATTSLGAIWSSCSPDFGSSGILDRFLQIEPKIIFFSSSYFYGKKFIDCKPVIESVKQSLPMLKELVIVDHLGKNDTEEVTFNKILELMSPRIGIDGLREIEFASMKFSDPVYILFSSGTTGKPKCIVHGIGGTLIQHKKELMLHTDLKSDDLLFYFTTCGWMMWNWMVTGLSVGARILTFDGSVGQENFGILWRIVAHEKVNVFGTSPKFIASCMKAHYQPNQNLDYLNTILSTGSPLLEEHFEWIYSKVKKDIHLASISGGTDIISCFMLGNPLLPVYLGQIQSAGLGMAIEAWGPSGESLGAGQKGELVCTRSFPSMPVGFWNDPEGQAFHKAYFNYYRDKVVWRHGDWISITEEGGIVVFGRSDTTLNPGGVRIGTAEIYRQVEMIPEVLDAIVVGVPVEGDIAVVLFIKLDKGSEVDEIASQIKSRIRSELTPRHVPSIIIQVKDIPYTRSGKRVEMAVLNAVLGNKIENLGALTNPECLHEYSSFKERFIAR